MAKNKGLKNVKKGSASFQIKELIVDVWDSILNNQNSPIEIIDLKGVLILRLEPYGSVVMTDELRKPLDESGNFKNLVDKGIISIVKYQ